MTDWIRINPADLDITRHETGEFEGTEITIGLSPDDIPQKMRGRMSEDGGLIVEFKYLGTAHEPRKILKTVHSITPVVGSHTGRLYEIRFKANFIHEFHTKFQESIDRLILKNSGRKRHYEVAAEAVQDNADALQLQ